MTPEPHQVDIIKYEDERGGLMKYFEFFDSRKLGQIIQSKTALAGTVRGLHTQIGEWSEEKYIICLHGRLAWFAVDYSHYGATGVIGEYALEFAEGEAIYVPPHCLNGMVSLTDDVRLMIVASVGFDDAFGVNVSPFGDHFLGNIVDKYDLKNLAKKNPPNEVTQEQFLKRICDVT